MHACVLRQSCPTCVTPVDCSPPSFPVHSSPRILEWVAMPSSRESFPPRDWTQVSTIGRPVLYPWATWEAPLPHRSDIRSIFPLTPHTAWYVELLQPGVEPMPPAWKLRVSTTESPGKSSMIFFFLMEANLTLSGSNKRNNPSIRSVM